MKKSKQKRYHVEVYFPPWAEESLKVFTETIQQKGSLAFSTHAVGKIVNGNLEYGRQLFKYLLKSIRKVSLKPESIFEFYAQGEFVQKAVFRFSFEEFPVDIILVISADGTVITMYTTNKGDNHDSLNLNLYERKP